MIFVEAEEKRGDKKEKRGSPGAKAALQVLVPPHRTEEWPRPIQTITPKHPR